MYVGCTASSLLFVVKTTTSNERDLVRFVCFVPFLPTFFYLWPSGGELGTSFNQVVSQRFCHYYFLAVMIDQICSLSFFFFSFGRWPWPEDEDVCLVYCYEPNNIRLGQSTTGLLVAFIGSMTIFVDAKDV